MTREEEIRERCEEAVKMLRGLLPEKVDYADLVCAEGFARGFNYVWTDPEPYAMDEAANCIEALLTENARLRAELEAAINDMEALANREADPCDFCDSKGACHRPDSCPRAGYRNFKWRSPQEGANE